MYHLTLPKSGYISQIIHISDIHIKTGDLEKSRYNDYVTVFNNFEKILSLLPSIIQGSAVTVLTGDSFHFKNKLDSLSVMLFHYLINMITKYTPLFILQGNHDFLQSNGQIPDVISSLLYGNQNKSINYMDKTGHYVAGNVGFGLVCITDTLKLGDGSGHVESLPPFPSVSMFPSTVETRVALFHGPFKTSSLYSGIATTDGLPIDWVKSAGYDIGMFGDIHKTQIHPNDTSDWKNQFLWGYAGSLVQQDFGESVDDHGFLVWDINSRTVTHHNVPSPAIFLNTTYVNECMMCIINKHQHVPLIEFIETKKPRHIYIKVKGDIPTHELDTLQNKLKINQITCNITKGLLTDVHSDPLSITQPQTHIDISQYNSQNMWIDYIKSVDKDHILIDQNWEEWFKNPHELLLTDMNLAYCTLDEIISKRDKEIATKIDKLNNNLTYIKESKKQPFCLIYMKWDYIECYGKGNYFNFENAYNNICVINGHNSSGKSSFLEVILLGLYGEDFPSRRDKYHSASIICQNKPPREASQINIIFKLSNIYYQINRIFEPQSSNKNILHIKKMTLDEITSDGKLIKTLSTTNKSTNEWLEKNIGQFDSFIMSCIISQASDADFFSLKDVEQIQLLDEVLHIDCIDHMLAIFKETSLGLDAIQRQCITLKTHIMIDDQTLPTIDEEILTTKTALIASKNDELEKLKSIYTQSNETWHHLKQNDLILDDDIISSKIAEFKNLSSSINETVQQSDDINNLSQQRAIIESKIKEIGVVSNSLMYKPDCERQLINLEQNTPIKPQCTLDYYQTKINHIIDWRKKHKNTLINSTHSIITEIDKFSSNLAKLKTSAQKLLENKPNKPDITITQYIQFQQELENIHKTITSLPKPYDNLIELENFCINHKLSKINDTVSYNQIQHQIDEEIAKLLDHNWSSCDVTILDQLLEKNETLLANTNHQLITSHELLDTYEKQKTNVSREIDTYTDNINNFGDLIRPKKSVDEIARWLDNFSQLTSQLQHNETELSSLTNQYQQWTTLNDQLSNDQQKLERVVQEIETIEKQSLPFNPKCDACLRQPWKIRHLQLLSDKQQLIQSIETINLPQLDPIKIKAEITRLSCWIDQYHKLQKSVENYKTWKQTWIDFENRSKILDSLRNTRTEKYSVMTEIQKNIKTVMTDIKNKEIKKNKITSYIAGLHYAINNRPKWHTLTQQINDMKKYQQDLQLHQVYTLYETLNIEYHQKQKQLIDLTDQWHLKNTHIMTEIQRINTLIESLKNTLLIIQQNDTYTIEEKNYCDNIELWKTYDLHKDTIKNLKYCVYRHQLCTIDEQINKIKLLNDYQKQYNYWVDIDVNKPQYIKKLQINGEIDTLQKIIQELRIDYERHKISHNRHVKNLFEINTYNQIIEKTEEKQKVIDFILKSLVNYRSWLYTNIIIPNVVSEVNRTVSIVTHSTEYSLNATVSTDKHNKINIGWSINSPSGSAIIQKAGGYIKHIHGLIMRITLSRMGASHINNSQLFIDEGFTSCDSQNLEKIPDFLRNLLDVFSSGMFIVSHLQILKECGDLTVDIRSSSDSTTLIQFDNKSSPNQSIKQKISLKLTSAQKKVKTEADLCIAIKKDGQRCKYKVKNGQYCNIHMPKN